MAKFFRLVVWVGLIPYISMAENNPTAPHSPAFTKVQQARSEFRSHANQIKNRAQEFKDAFDAERVFLSERDRKFFRSSLEELKVNSLLSFESVMNRLGEVALEVKNCSNVVNPIDPCAGIAPKFQCGACEYPGSKTCNTISCAGAIISTVTQKCELDLSKFSCSDCQFFSYNTFRGEYIIYYQGIAVDKVVRSENYLETKQCTIAKNGDPRCKK